MSTRIPYDKDSKIEQVNSIRFNKIDEPLSPLILSNLNEPISNNLLNLRQLHEILEESQGLTKAQKLDYSNLKRYLMKLYLKEIASKKKE